jgi:hypothetical protein
MIGLASSTFADFRHYVFFVDDKSHPSNWYSGSSEGILRHSVRLFNESGELLGSVQRERLARGLDFISGADGFFSTPADPAAGWEAREGFYLSMVSLFRDVFSIDSMPPLAFMWFERMMVWSRDANGRTTLSEPRLRKAMLAAMREILSLKSRSCREAALHGLNHIHYEEPDAAAGIIDEFLIRDVDIDARLHQYARGCRDGRDR